MKKLFIFSTFLLLLAACNTQGEPYVEIKRNSYVLNYFDLENYTPVSFENSEFPYIQMTIQNDSRTQSFNAASYRFDENRGQQYQDLCRKHEDTTYPEEIINVVEYYELDNAEPMYPAHDILTVDIVSDRDFNDIPAGSSLANVVRLVGVSCTPYIQNSYSPVFDFQFHEDELSPVFQKVMEYTMKNYASYLIPAYPVDKMLSEITREDLELVGVGRTMQRPESEQMFLDIFSLAFEQQPVQKQHTFTITISADDGKLYTNKVKFEFPKR